MASERLKEALSALESRARHRVGIGAAARAGAIALAAGAILVAIGLPPTPVGWLVLAALPLSAYCARWSTALPRREGAAQLALAKAIDAQLAAEDRLPSSLDPALDPALTGRADGAAALLQEDAAAFEERALKLAATMAPIPWTDLRFLPLAAALVLASFWIAEIRTAVDEPIAATEPILDDSARAEIAAVLEEAQLELPPAAEESTDPLAELQRKLEGEDLSPNEALAAAAETMAALERERVEAKEEGQRLEALAQVLDKFEEMRDLSRALQEHRMDEARSMLQKMREEFANERKMLMEGKDGRTKEERERRLEEITERERQLDELEKAMERRAERLERLNRRVDATRRVTDRVRYAQSQRERQRYLDWLEREGEGEGGGREGARRLGGDRRGGGAGEGGDEWGVGTAHHEGEARRTSVAKVIERVAAEEGEGGVTRFFVTSDNDGSKSGLDARALVSEFERRALDTIYQEEVPLSFRAYVTRYFDRIKPPPAEQE